MNRGLFAICVNARDRQGAGVFSSLELQVTRVRLITRRNASRRYRSEPLLALCGSIRDDFISGSVGDALHRQEVLEDLNSRFGSEVTLGVKLHAVDWMLFVSQSHDQTRLTFARGPCRDLHKIRQCVFEHDQAVITRRGEGVWQAGKQSAAVVMNLRDLAVHQLGGSHDLASKNFAYALMPKAHSQHWHARSKLLNDRFGKSRFSRRAGAGRNDDSLGLKSFDFIERDLVVAFHSDVERRVGLAQALDQVVGKGVVVIENEDHE